LRGGVVRGRGAITGAVIAPLAAPVGPIFTTIGAVSALAMAVATVIALAAAAAIAALTALAIARWPFLPGLTARTLCGLGATGYRRD